MEQREVCSSQQPLYDCLHQYQTAERIAPYLRPDSLLFRVSQNNCGSLWTSNSIICMGEMQLYQFHSARYAQSQRNEHIINYVTNSFSYTRDKALIK